MKYFIVIDMQEDFLTGSLANPNAVAIVPKIIETLEEKIRESYTIIATKDTHHPKNYLESQEGKNLPVLHCIAGSKGWEVDNRITPYIDYFVIKHSFGYDKWADFFNSLKQSNKSIECIEICGTVSSICVLANAVILKAIFPEVSIIVHKDLCADLTPERQEATMKVLAAQQIKVV